MTMNKTLKWQVCFSKVGFGSIQARVPKRDRADSSFYGQEEQTYF